MTDARKSRSLLAVAFALGGAASAQTPAQIFGETLFFEHMRFPGDVLEFGDLDGDGLLDALWCSEGDVNLCWQRGNGDGSFGPSRELSFDVGAHSSLSASIADLDGDGDADIMTTNLPSVGYGAVRTYENLGRGRFQTPRTVGEAPGSAVNGSAFNGSAFNGSVVDLDGDGARDLLFSSKEGRIRWCRNLGAMNFGAASVVVDAGVVIQQVIASDMEGDGDLDILFCSPDENAIFQVENLGGGDFGPRRLVTAHFTEPKDLEAADVDGDGDMDILSFASGSHQFGWCANLGEGEFAPPKAFKASAYSSPVGLSAGDVDGDGDTDVIASWGSADGLTWFANAGNGVFGAAKRIAGAEELTGVTALVDLDQDGDLDPVVTSYEHGTSGASWAENQGPGVFGPLAPLSTSTQGLTDFHFVDLDADGDLECVARDAKDRVLVAIENQGKGRFSGREILGTSNGWFQSTDAADMDGDNDIDIVVAAVDGHKLSIQWFENEGLGRFTEPVELVSGSLRASDVRVSLRDFDRDGDMDVLSEYTLLIGGRNAAWIKNDGAGKFTALPRRDIGLGTRSLPMDFDGDGDLDLVVLDITGRDIDLKVHWNEAGVLGAAQALDAVDSAWPSFAASDFDGDGTTNLFVLDGTEVKLYLGAGGAGEAGLTTASTLVTLTWSATDIAALDLDSDGDDDLVAHSPASAAWFENLGNGSVGPEQAIPGWSRQQLSSRLGAADLDGDGDIDLYREIPVYLKKASGLMIHLNEGRSEVRYGGLGAVNSSGRSASITVSGSPSVSKGDLLLIAHHLPADRPGLFTVADAEGLAALPGGSEEGLCVDGGSGRTAAGEGQVFLSSPRGDATLPLELTGVEAPVGPALTMAGRTLRFRGWFQDTAPGATSHFTGDAWVTFRP